MERGADLTAQPLPRHLPGCFHWGREACRGGCPKTLTLSFYFMLPDGWEQVFLQLEHRCGQTHGDTGLGPSRDPVTHPGPHCSGVLGRKRLRKAPKRISARYGYRWHPQLLLVPRARQVLGTWWHCR